LWRTDFRRCRGRPRGALPPTFFDLDDVEHVVALRRRRAHLSDKVLGLMALPALFLEERRSVHRATRTLVCSDADASRLRKVFGKDSVDAVPNALPLPSLEPGLSATHSMLMVAAYDYEPNADGADFFLAEVLPLIRSRLPTAELWLVGPAAEKMTAFIMLLRSKVSRIRPISTPYEAARTIVPFATAAAHESLAEAAGYAKPIVSTTSALRTRHDTRVMRSSRIRPRVCRCG
jgi:hypothetical protein